MYAPNFASLTTPLSAPPFLSFYHSFHCHLTNFYRSEDSTFFIFLLTQRFLAHMCSMDSGVVIGSSLCTRNTWPTCPSRHDRLLWVLSVWGSTDSRERYIRGSWLPHYRRVWLPVPSLNGFRVRRLLVPGGSWTVYASANQKVDYSRILGRLDANP